MVPKYWVLFLDHQSASLQGTDTVGISEKRKIKTQNTLCAGPESVVAAGEDLIIRASHAHTH